MSDRSRTALFYIVLFLLTFSVRVINLDRASFWLDETLQTSCTSGPISGIWDCFARDKPPLDYYIQGFFLRFGHDEWWGRIHSTILGSLFVVAMAWWGKITGGWKRGLLVAGCVFALPVTVRFSQEARPYALMLLGEALFLGSLARISFVPKRTQTFHFVMMGLGVFISIWSLYFAWPMLGFAGVPIFLWVLISRKRRQTAFAGIPTRLSKIIFSGAVILIVAFSVFPLLRSHDYMMRSDFYDYDVRDHWSRISEFLDNFLCGYQWYQSSHNVWPLLLGWMSAGLVTGLLRRRDRTQAILLTWLFLSLFSLSFFLAWWRDHWMIMRYTLCALPPAVMLAVIGLENFVTGFAAFARRARRPKWGITIATLLGLTIASLHTTWVLTNPVRRPDWRGITEFLKPIATKETEVLLLNDLPHRFNYYFNRYGVPATAIPIHPGDEQLIVAYMMGRPDAFATRNPSFGGHSRTYLLDEISWWRKDFEMLTLFKVSDPSNDLELREQLMSKALSRENPELEIVPYDSSSGFVGRSWYTPENWGEQHHVRSIARGYGEVVVPLEEPMELKLDVLFFVYRLELEPQRTVSLYVNNELLDNRVFEDGHPTLSWTIPADKLRTGLNLIAFRANTSYQPGEIEEGSKDFRHLSLWVENINVRVTDTINPSQ